MSEEFIYCDAMFGGIYSPKGTCPDEATDFARRHEDGKLCARCMAHRVVDPNFKYEVISKNEYIVAQVMES